MTTAWSSIHNVDTPSESQMSSIPTYNWNPLEIGFIKFNIDGALFKDSGFVGMSSVIRNHMGAFVAVMSEHTRGPLDTLSMEGLCSR